MKAKFSKRMSPELQAWLNKCFKVATARLGIADYDRVVLVKLGYGSDVRGERGSIVPYPQPGWVLGGVVKRYMVTLVPDHPLMMLESFCHELVHLKQWCFGELSIGPREGGTGPYLPLYFNQNIKDVPYRERPQEHEAHGRMTELALYVLKRVGPPERESEF